MTTTATRPVSGRTSNAAPRDRSRAATAVAVGSEMAGAARTAAADAVTQIPRFAAMGRSAFDDANRRIASSPDEMVRLTTVLSFGVAAGLLVGGAPRLLVGAALLPVGMLGLTLLERTAADRTGAGTAKAAAGL